MKLRPSSMRWLLLALLAAGPLQTQTVMLCEMLGLAQQDTCCCHEPQPARDCDEVIEQVVAANPGLAALQAAAEAAHHRIEPAGSLDDPMLRNEDGQLVSFVFVILYLHRRSLTETLVVMSALPFSLIGSIWLLALLDYNLSVAV